MWVCVCVRLRHYILLVHLVDLAVCPSYVRSILIVRASVKSLRRRPFLCARAVHRQFRPATYVAPVDRDQWHRSGGKERGWFSPIDERYFGDRAEPSVLLFVTIVQILFSRVSSLFPRGSSTSATRSRTICSSR